MMNQKEIEAAGKEEYALWRNSKDRVNSIYDFMASNANAHIDRLDKAVTSGDPEDMLDVFGPGGGIAGITKGFGQGAKTVNIFWKTLPKTIQKKLKINRGRTDKSALSANEKKFYETEYKAWYAKNISPEAKAKYNNKKKVKQANLTPEELAAQTARKREWERADVLKKKLADPTHTVGPVPPLHKRLSKEDFNARKAKLAKERWEKLSESEKQAVRDKENAYRKTIYEKDPAVAASKAQTKAKRDKRTPKWLTEKDWEKIDSFYFLRDSLTKATGKTHDVDHVIPKLGKNISGLHVPNNLQVIPASSNRSKQNKINLDDIEKMGREAYERTVKQREWIKILKAQGEI